LGDLGIDGGTVKIELEEREVEQWIRLAQDKDK